MKACFRIPALLLASALAVSAPSFAAVNDSLVSGVEVTFVIRPGYGLLGSGRDYGFYQLGLGTLTSSTTHQTIDAGANWRHIAFGNHYALALKADSTLWGWGRGATYAFGDNTTNNRSTPTQVGSTKWIKVVAGLYVANSFGIRHDSTLWVWGRNQGGGLGTGDGNNKTTPVQLGSSKWLEVSNINNHGLAIRSDSTLWGWGWSSQNNLTSAVSGGLNKTPAQLDASGKWIRVFAGYDYSFGIKADSTLWTWGYNQYGLTGLGTTSGNQATPVQLGSHKWLKVKGNQQVVMALRADSTLWAWGTSGYDGSNGYGTLGQGPSVTDISTPGQIGSAKYRDFSLGSGEAIAIDASGGYWAWGKNAFGGIGDGTTTARLSPVRIAPGQTHQTLTFAALPSKTFLDADFPPGATASSGLTVSYASSNTAVATIVSGQIHLVGAGTTTITASQAGNSTYGPATEVSQSLTVSNPPRLYKDRKITGGNEFTLVIRDGIGVYGTGRNSNYRLGLGDTVARNRYHLIAPGNWRHVDGGGSYALALKEDSTLWGWGYQYYGFGDGATQHNTPAQIGSSHWISVSAGLYVNTNLGIRADSTLWAWGDNNYGLYGNGTTTTQSSPTQVGSDKWLALSHASIHVLGIKADHTLWAWGYANSGRLGNGATSGNVTSPIQIGSSRWLMVAAGYETSYAIRSDSTLWAWGVNMAGGTGQGTTAGNTTTPAQVGAGSKWIWVGDANWGGAVAMKADSTLWTWGSNAETLVAVAPNNATPGQVGSAKWRQVTLGYFGGLGQDAAGDFYGWGNNSAGHIGDSSNTTRTAPTLSKFNRSQTVTFSALPAKTYGDADFSLSGTASSGLSITYSSSNTAVATVSGSTVTLVAAGSTDITASQAGSAAYDAASAIQTLTVNKASQTITFTALPAKTWLDADYAPGAMASSGLTVTYASSNTSVATIVSNQIHLVGAGTTTITASQAGNATYAAATDATQNLTVAHPPHPHQDRKLAVGSAFQAAIREGVGIFTTGHGDSYRTGLGSAEDRNNLHLVAPGSWRHVDLGYSSAFAIKGDSTLWGWGLQATGFGDGTVSHPLPVQIGTDRWITVAVNNAFDGAMIGIQADSSLWVWGQNYYGVQGHYDLDTLPAPTRFGADKWLEVSFHSEHVLALKADHTLWVWGNSSAGRSGILPNPGDLASPTQIGSHRWRAVAAGYLHSSAIRSDSTLWAWGSNILGRTGLGTTSGNTTTPAQVGVGSKWIGLDAGTNMGLALKADSTLWTWGSNNSGAIAQGATASVSTPTQVGTGKWRQAAVNAGNGIGLLESGDFHGWGANGYGAVGDSTNTDRTTPSPAKFNRNQTLTFPALAAKNVGDADFAPGAGANTGLSVTYSSSDNSVATIVSGQIHIVGAGTTTITATQSGNAYFDPADSARTLTVTKLAQSITFNALPAKTYGDPTFTLGATAGSGLTVAYASSDPAVATVSGNTVTVVGPGTTTLTASQAGNSTYAAAAGVPQTLTVAKAAQSITFPAFAAKDEYSDDFAPGATASSGLTVSYASSDTMVATVVSGLIHVVGPGTATITASQAGDATYSAAADVGLTLTVASVSHPHKDRLVAGGASFQGVIRPGVGLYTTGHGSGYRLGLGDLTGRNSLHLAAPGSWRHLDLGLSNGFALKADSTLWAWGTLTNGGLGDGQTEYQVPTQIGSSRWITVTAGTVSTSVVYGIQADSTLWVWGENGFGLHGDGTSAHKSAPTRIGSGKWLDISIYYDHVLALKSDHTLWVWGNSANGRAGIVGAPDPITTPTQIGTSRWRMMAAGSAHSFAIRSDSTLWAWGANTSGATGRNTSTGTTTTPTQIGVGDKWLWVHGSSSTGLAIRSDSTLWTWGSDINGMIAQGNTFQRLVPAQVESAKWLQASLTNSNGMGLQSSGDFYGWGSNGVGSVGDSTTTDRSTPALAKFNRDQVFTFPAFAAKTVADADFAPGASANTGLSITYSSSDTAVATMVSGQVHIVGAGTATITATQAGNAYFDPASSTQVLTVAKLPQTLTFNALSSRTYREAPFTLGATAGSGLSPTYASSDTTVARISGDTVFVVGAGTADITASQAGNGTYAAASDVVRTLTVGKASQSISFPTLASKTMLDADFAPGGSSSSGLAVSYASSNTSVATMVSGQIHLVGAGTATITASQAGNGNYNAAADSAQTLAVSLVTQSITFNALSSKTYGDAAFALSASAGSGLSVAFASSDTSVARISGDTLTVVGAGSADITASQAGNGTYAAATDVVRTLTVNKASQSISFPALAGKDMDDADFAPGASASSGLSVSYASSNTSVATIISGQIHIVGAGTATITASQAGNSNYDAAADSAQSLTVSKLNQTITFTALSSKTYGDSAFALGATAGSGLTVTYASSDTSVARISGSTLTMLAAGSADITATQAGDGTHAAAADVMRTLTVNKANQAISFPALAAKTMLDADFAPGASASSGFGVTYASSNTSVATIVSGQIHIVGAGTAIITASQDGNGNYSAAADSAQSLTVSLVSQSITFNALSSKTYGDTAFALGATASSGRSVSYASSDTTVAKVSGSTVTIIGSGSADITASQAGNSTYAAASDAVRTLTINKAGQTISFSSLPAKNMGDADFAPGASATSGLGVSYASSNASVATIVSGQIHIVGAGTATITASQAGNGNYEAAADSSQTLTVSKLTQAITFNALSAKTYGDSAFALGGTASSGLSVTYASSDTTVARISGSTVTVVAAGTAGITASQAGNNTYAAAADVARTLTVNKADQAIAFSALPAKNMGDADFAPGASANSGLAVSYASSNTAVATITSGQIHIVGAGSTTITASQAGNANYNAAADSSQTLTVSKQAQTITFNALSAKTYGDSPFSLGATSSSGLTVSYASSDTTVAKVSGSTVTVIGAGTADLTASQAGDGTYSAASNAVRTLTVNKASQSISFPSLAAKIMGDADFAPGASASSGLSVSYASSNTAVATIVSGQIHIVGAGSSTITASQSGGINHNAAPDSSQTLTVNLASQSITFNALSAKTYGDGAFALEGTASSGLSVTYASSDTTVAKVSGSTVTMVAAGSVDITASQAGNSTYAAATDVVRTLTVSKAGQTIAFSALLAKNMGDADFAPGASASSGLTVSYASSNTAVATITGGQIHVVGAGTTTITASQAGNANYNAAADSSLPLTVTKLAQAITFTTLSTKTYGDAAFSLGATAGSGLTVTYASSDTTVAKVSGSTVTMVAAGSADITASQAGNGTYSAATDVVRTLTVNKAAQAITFSALPAKLMLDTDFAPGATASSGLAVSYASSNTSVATMVSGQIHIVGVGSTTITASQAGNGNYLAAPDSARTLTVGLAPQSITFNTLAAKSFGDGDFSLGATATSGLGLTYASSDTMVAKVSGSTVTIVGAGSADITASQAGNGSYAAATDVVRALTVNKAFQSLTFPALAGKIMGDVDFAPGASATSGLGVSYASSNTAVATIVSGKVHIVGVGSATITASQAGNANNAAAADLTQNLSVGSASQTITFTAPSAKTFGDAAFALSATASSGLAVSFASSDTLVARISGSTVTLLSAGSANITASQAGDGTYSAAAGVVHGLTVNKAPQAITFPTLSAKIMGDADFTLGASASSNLAVSYTSSNPAVATVVAGQIHIVGPGTTDITASQGGNGNYLAAADAVQSLTVTTASQAITFNALPSKTYGDSAFALNATASSGLSVSYASSDTLVARISGSTVTMVGAGSAEITASQGGNGTTAAAAPVTRTLTVNKAPQTLAFPALPAKTFGDADFAPGATTGSGLTPAYVSSDTTVATLVNGQIHLVGSGTATIAASQPGNANYLAAAEATQTLTVAKAAHTLTFSLGSDTLRTEGDAAFKLNATSSVGLAVRFTSSDTTVARVTGDSVRIGRAGAVELTAHQDGNAQYAAAASVTRTLRVRTAIPTPLTLQDLNPPGAMNVDTSLLISWARKEKATGYRLQATRSPTGALFLDTSLADTSFTLAGLAFGSTVKWSVTPFNATGHAVAAPISSITVRPAPPIPVDVARVPIQAKEGMGTTVELTWPPVDNSTAYRVQASLDGSQAPLIDTVITQPSLTLKELAPGGKYVWRVAPMNGISEAPFTPWLTFSVRDKDDGAVTRGIVVDSSKDAKVSDIVAVSQKDSALGNVTLTLTEDKKAPVNLPGGFMPLTGNINLNASNSTGALNDSQITITLTPPDTSLDGTSVGGELPLVYTIDSATGELRVVYDLPRDSAGRITLPLSHGKSFILAVDTVSPVVKDSTPSEPRPAGSNLVISGVVDDNVRNCRTTLRYRRGGEETFDSVTVTIDAQGRFELPLDLQLDSTGFEYSLTATDGRNVKGNPSSNVPVEIKTIHAADSLPSMQWRLFALPTLPKETRWADLAPSLGTYGEDWKLFARTGDGLKEFGAAMAGMDKAEAGVAYWLKSRKKSFTPALSGGVAAPVNKPFELVLPPKSWISFGNPFLFPVSWQSVLDSSHAAAAALVGPYTFRDTAWISPLEIPALQPWEGYYAYNATQDTLRIRIPALKAKNAQPVLAKAAFHLQWQVRGADGKDAGNFFGGLGDGESALAKAASGTAALGTASQAASRAPLWQTPKPESPDAGLRAGFVSPQGAAGLLQTDFRGFAAEGGLTWSARLSGLSAGRSYTNRFIGFESLPEGTAVAVADPVTGSFTTWSAGMSYTVEAQAGEEGRELLFYAGSPEYVQSRGAEFSAAHPFTIELKNYPNPMRGFTVIHFAVPVSAKGQQRVKLSLYDMQGRLVRQLASGPRATGRHSLRWDGLDARGRGVAAGSYRLLLEIGNRKMNRPLQILP